jgi:hypothetical protein
MFATILYLLPTSYLAHFSVLVQFGRDVSFNCLAGLTSDAYQNSGNRRYNFMLVLLITLVL